MIRLFLCALLLFFAVMPSGWAQTPAGKKTVLVIYDGYKEFSRIQRMDHTIENALETGLNHPVTIRREYFDFAKLDTPDDEQSLRTYYHAKYDNNKPDVVIVFHSAALDFLLKPGSEVFPGIPIISAGIDRWEYKYRSDDKKIPPNVTGIILSHDIWPTIQLALKLQPKIQHVVVVVGSNVNDRSFELMAHGELRDYEKQFDFNYIAGIPLYDMLDRLRNLPPQTIIIYLSYAMDNREQNYNPDEVLSAISREANAPVYVTNDTPMAGAVGGDLVSYETCAKAASDIAVRVLQGEAPSEIPFLECSNPANTLDALQLERWKIPIEQAPPGSIILNRPEPLLREYFWRIFGCVCLIILQSILIAMLLVNQHLRRRAEEKLRISEARESASILEERSRMARDMHDTLAQGFTGVILQLAAAEGNLEPGSSPKALEHLQRASKLARESLGEARRSIRALRPLVLEQGNLLMAVDRLLKKMTDDSPLHAEFRTHGEIRPLPPFTEENVLRVVQEILTNTIKHSNAPIIVVDLGFEPNSLYLVVQDNGRGFDVANTQEGMGLRGIRERVQHLNGELVIQSQYDQGTIIQIIVPDIPKPIASPRDLLLNSHRDG